MLRHFFQELAEISPILPWLVRTLIVLLVVVIAWVLLSVPAFWLCRAIGPHIRNAKAGMAAMADRLFARSAGLFRSCANPIEGFIADHAQMFSFEQENSQIRTAIDRLRATVEAIPNRIASLELSLSEAEKKFVGASETLTQIEIPQPMEPPSPQQFAAVQKGRNRAWITLIVAVILTPPLVGFNTGMLNEFFGSFWTGLEYAGVQLSLVISLFATILEISLGAFLVLFPSKPAQLALMAGIGLLAFVEGSFYARVGQGFQWSIFDAFYAPGEAPAWTKLWFAVFGPVLVLGLAFAGHALFGSISQLADQHVIRQWKTYVQSRMDKASQLRQRLDEAHRAKGLLTGSLVEVQTSFSTTQGMAGSSLTTIETAKNSFLEEIKKTELIRLGDARRLDRGAMLRQFYECILFAGMIIFALALIAFIYGFFPAPPVANWLSGLGFGWTIALSEAVILLIAGSASSRANTVLPATEGLAASNPHHSSLGTIMGGIMLGVVLIGNAFYCLHPFSLFNVMLWAVLAAANVAIFWCGTRLGMILAAVWAVLCAAACAATAVGVAALVVCVWAVWVLFAVLLVALIALAFPYSILFLRDPSGSQILPRVAAT